MSKYLKLLRLSGLSEQRYNWAESRFYEDDEFSFSCVEFEMLMRDPCSRQLVGKLKSEIQGLLLVPYQKGPIIQIEFVEHQSTINKELNN